MNNEYNTCISWSSVRADKLIKIGNRPINSGMRPYAIRSALSTWKLLMLLLDAFGRVLAIIILTLTFVFFSTDVEVGEVHNIIAKFMIY